MPHLKKKRLIRDQKLKAKKKRNNYLGLSKRDFEDIKRNRDFAATLNSRYNSLAEVCKLHGIDFPGLIKELKKQFPGQRIEVLDEGAGKSTFAKELTETANREIGEDSLNVTKTDIIGNPEKQVIEASPEQLLQRFGPEKFHFVSSTFSGMHSTHLDFGKGMENILRVLKPGGKASILVSKKDLLVLDRLEDQLDRWAKRHSNISFKVREFMKLMGNGEEVIPFTYLQIILVKH